MSAKNNKTDPHPSLNEEDFYYNSDGLIVFTKKYLLKRGYCCSYGCRHCPYGFNRKDDLTSGSNN